jgi:hypothetical protein
MTDALEGAELMDAIAQRSKVGIDIVIQVIEAMGDITWDVFEAGGVVEIPGLGAYSPDNQALDDFEAGLTNIISAEKAAKAKNRARAAAKKTTTAQKGQGAVAKKTTTKKATGARKGVQKASGPSDDPLGTPAKAPPVKKVGGARSAVKKVGRRKAG